MLQRLTISQRFWLWAAFATAIFYGAAALAWFGLAAARDIAARVEHVSQGTEELARVAGAMEQLAGRFRLT